MGAEETGGVDFGERKGKKRKTCPIRTDASKTVGKKNERGGGEPRTMKSSLRKKRRLDEEGGKPFLERVRQNRQGGIVKGGRERRVKKRRGKQGTSRIGKGCDSGGKAVAKMRRRIGPHPGPQNGKKRTWEMGTKRKGWLRGKRGKKNSYPGGDQTPGAIGGESGPLSLLPQKLRKKGGNPR